MARWGESAWGCLGSGPVHRGALWAMLCVSVSIHSRRGALSVLPRTRCQTPLPPPSMLPPRGQPAEWRTSLPGCLRTCVSHTHSHTHADDRRLLHTSISRSFERDTLIFVSVFSFSHLNVCARLKWWSGKSHFYLVSSQKLPVSWALRGRDNDVFGFSLDVQLEPLQVSDG